ncbi:MAG: transposase [Chloroflexota bacterium]
MRTPSGLYRKTPIIYKCELDNCPQCGQELVEMSYLNGLKTVQTMSQVTTIAYRPKRCVGASCASSEVRWPSATWQQIAPKYSIYGYDVIAQIGWERQKGRMHYDAIYAHLSGRIQISASQVRHLYQQRYLPLLDCHERGHYAELEVLARQSGLLLSLDGLMPEGGEPQLWIIRELQTGWTLRSGWMNCQDERAFVEFLEPIAALNLSVKAVMSDKQRGLLPAVKAVFPNALHGFCQFHYLDNAAEPIAKADEQMKIELRQTVRGEIGDLIRQRKAEKPPVAVVTGIIPSPIPSAAAQSASLEPEVSAQQERESIVQDILSRVRYLLTLKGRPPFRLAGVEMYARLLEVTACLQELIQYQPEPRLLELQAGLHKALIATHSQYNELSQAANWLADLADVLDPEGKPVRAGEQVRIEWEACLTRIETQAQRSSRLQEFSAKIHKVSLSYAPGLFYTYDLPALPRTNNHCESEFRELRRRLSSTTGQVGATKCLLFRQGAWELIPGPSSLSETIAAISHVEFDQFLQERQRVRIHRAPFRLHTRSAKQSQAQLRKLIQRWKALPPSFDP